ncbi:MAG: hypothetical protein K0S70_124 [Microbacterium sp.]|jgi:hypothetical protein|nr:hypothetical protein [Microbacterium sp.]
MAKVKWHGGKTLRHAERLLVTRRDELRSDLTEALEDSIERGAMLTQDNLEEAVTRTGIRRVEQATNPSMALGGEDFSASAFPGRHVTGNMVGSVSHEVRTPRARRVTGVFGWWGSNYEDYFRDQDLGEGNIPAARALPMAYIQALSMFRERVVEIVNKK